MISTFGNISSYVTDNEPAMQSNAVKSFLAAVGAKQIKITAYNATANRVERAHQELSASLVKLTTSDSIATNWDLYLGFANHAQNRVPAAATGVSPHHFLFGRLPQPILIEQHVDDATLADFAEGYNDIVRSVNERLLAQATRVDNENALRRSIPFREGSWVYVKRNHNQKSTRFDPLYYGPYKIVRLHDNLSCDLALGGLGDTIKVNVKRLKHVNADFAIYAEDETADED
jgi:hypothetical protein